MNQKIKLFYRTFWLHKNFWGVSRIFYKRRSFYENFEFVIFLKNSIFEVCWEIATSFNLVSMEMIQVIEVCFDIYFQQKQTLTVCRISHHKWWPYNFQWEKRGSVIWEKTLCSLVKAFCSKSFERCLRKWCSQRLNDRFSIKLKITSLNNLPGE